MAQIRRCEEMGRNRRSLALNGHVKRQRRPNFRRPHRGINLRTFFLGGKALSTTLDLRNTSVFGAHAPPLKNFDTWDSQTWLAQAAERIDACHEAVPETALNEKWTLRRATHREQTVNPVNFPRKIP